MSHPRKEDPEADPLIGQIMKMQTARNASVVDKVEILGVAHGMIRLRFIERSRKPVVWVPIDSILELRETDEMPP
jgi:hypothetical protein